MTLSVPPLHPSTRNAGFFSIRSCTIGMQVDEPPMPDRIRRAIIASENFILATRDTGYRSVSAAVAELVDNSLQAKASHIRVCVSADNSAGQRSLSVAVLDDGCGMTPELLESAVQFGGSDRFGERTGIGRFGMGLPNSSVSQTRHFEVFSWRDGEPVWSTYLDVDEIAAGALRSIPSPYRSALPSWAAGCAATSGTLVVWARCDRLSRSRTSTVVTQLRHSLGRWYRFALWDGVRISVNDADVSPSDPLYIHRNSVISGAAPFGPPLVYEFQSTKSQTAAVVVRFSELPVGAWQEWSVEEKRRAGIVGRAGVSIVRAGREIDYGWYLMGSKRRENYDDWWRCEVQFTPALDELFGVTHSKQGITPSAELKTALEADLEATARTLNGRVRSAFEQARSRNSDALRAARFTDQFLPTPPRVRRKVTATGIRYRIEIAQLPTPDFYQSRLLGDTLVVTVNSDHPFYKLVYSPLINGDSKQRFYVECVLLGAARADLEATDREERELIDRMRRSWADAIATFLSR